MVAPLMRLGPHSLGFTLLIGALAGLPVLSTDMGLPGLPLLELGRGAGGLAATTAQAALTLSVFMAGFGGAQVILGPLSDRIGRRPVLLGGLALYTLAGLVCALAPSVGFLLAARLAQGAGAAVGTVLSFAILRDLFDGPAARARLSTVSMVYSVAPIIAPTLGGLMLRLGGWRDIFGLLALTGLLLLGAAALGLPETRRQLPVVHYAAVLRQGRTVGYGLVGAMSIGNVFAFVAGSPLVLLGLRHMSVPAFGGVFAIITSGVVAGAAVNRRLIARGIGADLPLGGGLLLAALAGLAAAGLAATGLLDLPALVVLMFASTFARGLVGPNITHAALERVPQMAGAASALIGSLQMLTGALSGLVVGVMVTRLGGLGMVATMAGFAVPAVAAWLVVRRW
ncbi:MAG: Bcr/CflA family efflux MFS transporter [Rhodospirillales bacterium]|nr:Bcr/CflA family efflux MFS transporter [Rhodospirillales bacterium]